ncbi:hypothetical protein [Nonomuraea jabiensis]|uniref:Uncharacterized protein n=1 Tax=Nonomuraea jabiensis TaxID=882448 RepID=A0A7W9GDL2_9ACTN|nr:hypothetical protein [Nonomuraea jabiensis]MBB5781845.1 hypothetical protein [Nonomuraea jabiensis]
MAEHVRMERSQVEAGLKSWQGHTAGLGDALRDATARIERLHTTQAHPTQDTTPTPRSREEVYARRRGPADDPEADPDLWALRAVDGRMSESRYRDEDAERQAGKILQRIANTWGRDGIQWLLDTFQARSSYVRDGIVWAARQNGLAGPSGEQQSTRPLGQSGRSGQPQEASYQAEDLYDSQADRRHWKDVMREADHLAHQYTAADRNQNADAFQDAIDDTRRSSTVTAWPTPVGRLGTSSRARRRWTTGWPSARARTPAPASASSARSCSMTSTWSRTT